MRKLFIKIGIYSIAASLLLLNSCKDKKCEETWTIKGRLLNGTTLQPIKNVWFSATLYDLNHNNKATNQTPVGQGITDDSGFFSIEYPCKEKTFEKIDFETLAPYGGYVRDNVKFEKHYFNTFYYSTQGRVHVILKPKKPLNSDTLFIEGTFPGLVKRDSFTTEYTGLWVNYHTINKGGAVVYAARRRTLLDSIKQRPSSYQENGWWSLPYGITGDPFIDSLIVEY
ncbi:MAG: hypothetical protein IT263_12025 [Saprospiraceae bacterium]|nr:hypothetical protein [Saprospiraceae bacterium]